VERIDELIFREQVVRKLLLRLTPYQVLILHLVAIGKSKREIGRMVGTTHKAIEYHVCRARDIAREIASRESEKEHA